MDAPDEADPIRIPIEDVFDLHTIAPRDVKGALEAYLEEAHKLGMGALRIIHGRGIGVQREMVRSVLARTPYVLDFRDAPAESGGWGATVVTLGDVKTVTNAGEMKEADTSGLEKLPAEFDATLRDAEELTARLSVEQFNWRPQPGRWSIGECLDHLAIADRLFAARLTAAIKEARRQKRFAAGPFRYSFLQSYFLRSAEPPPRLRLPAPRVFAPVAGHYEPAVTMEEFRRGNRQLARLAGDAKGIDLVSVKVASPAAGFWKWSIGIVLPICAAHERRHLYQARQVRTSSKFPAR